MFNQQVGQFRKLERPIEKPIGQEGYLGFEVGQKVKVYRNGQENPEDGWEITYIGPSKIQKSTEGFYAQVENADKTLGKELPLNELRQANSEKTLLENNIGLEADLEIVSFNLRIMEIDMQTHSAKESMAGNAGSVLIDGKAYGCVGLNGYAEKETGAILVFGNIQDVSDEIKDRAVKFTFKEAKNSNVAEILADFNSRKDKSQNMTEFLNNRKSKISKIVEFLGAEKFSEKGRKNIELAINAYNAIYW